ncbi:MAG: TOBE domain-containing protein, partial [Pseudomonadota bacterium]
RVAVLDGGVIQQIGTPMELYDNPLNRFIANFVGTINLVPGRIETTSGGTIFESPLGRITLPPSAATAPAGAAEIALRPHTLALAAPDRSADPTHQWIDGQVAEREFLGEFIRYTVRVGDTRLIIDSTHYAGEPSFAPGNAVKVGVNPRHARLLTA